MKPLGHGTEPCHIETRDLRRTDPECVGKLRRWKCQGPGRRGSRADRTDRAGDVIAARRMRQAGADAESQTDLVPGSQRRQELLA